MLFETWQKETSQCTTSWETTFNTNCDDWSRYLRTKTSKTYKELEPRSISTTAMLATEKHKANNHKKNMDALLNGQTKDKRVCGKSTAL